MADVRAHPRRRTLASEPLADLLRAHDIYLAPSRDDPSSNALLGALACGLPAASCAAADIRSWSVTRESVSTIRRSCRQCSRGWRPSSTSARARYPCAVARWSGRPLSRGACTRERRPAALAGSCAAYVRARTSCGRGFPSLRRRRRFRLVDRRRPRAPDCRLRAARLRRRACCRGHVLRKRAVRLPPRPLRRTAATLARVDRTGSASATSTAGPGTAGYPEFDRAFETLKRTPRGIDRVQVTHAECASSCSPPASTRRRCTDPDRCRPRPLPLGDERSACAARAGARRSRVGVRRRLLSQGRRRARGTGSSPKLVKGPDTLVAVVERLTRRRPGAVRAPHRDRRAATCSESSSDSASPTATCTSTQRDELASAYHALDVSSCFSAGGRAEGRARVAGVGRAARDDAGRTGVRARGRRAERPVRRRGRRRGARRGRHARPRRRRPRPEAPHRAAEQRRRRTQTIAWTGAGPNCSTASSRKARLVPIDRARAGRYARAGRRWARLLAPDASAPTASESSTATTSCRRKASASPAGRPSFSGSHAASPTTPATSTCSISARRLCPAISKHCCCSPGGVASRSS